MAKNPAPKKGPNRKNGDPAPEVEELREKVRELEEALDAIRSGEVDAIVVSKGDARQVYTLEGSDQPYRVLVENIREGALTLSRDGMILYANQRFAEMVKQPAPRVAGNSILDYVCPEHREEIAGALRDILTKSCRTRLRLRQGEKGSLPVLISMNPLDHGDNTKVSAVITDRRKDEERIQLQARMLDAVGDAVIAADTANRIIYWNDAATRTYGWTAEEAIGRDLVDVATPEISKKEARKIAVKLASGGTWSGEYVVKHRDGHEFPIYANDAPVFDDDGRLIAIIGASHDITGQKQAERDLASRNQELLALNEDLSAIHEELRQTNDDLKKSNESLGVTEEELRNSNSELQAQEYAVSIERDRVKNLLDIAGVMILALDRKGKVTMMNRRGCEILGHPEEEILGKDWISDFLPASIWTEMRAAFRDVLATDVGDFRSHENPVITRDGSLRDILWSNVLIRDRQGRVTGILSSGEDITVRKRAEEDLSRHYKTLTGINRILEAVLTSPTERDLGTACLKIAQKLTGSRFAFIGQVNEKGVRDIAVSNPGWDACVTADAGGHRKSFTDFKIHGIYGRVITDGKSLFTNDPAHHPDRIGLPKGHPPLESFLGVPLIHNGKVTGIIAVANRPRGYTVAEQETLEALAPVIVEAFLRRRAEDELRKRHEDLNTAYEEITATQEELKQNVEELTSREHQLSEALAEKEILLSEIHHRVKNNLSAFISLLSLKGSTEETPAGKALKQDLQNRARTMALIHETLYRTRQYADVDMEDYLTTLVNQVVGSYSKSAGHVGTAVEAKGIMFDLTRATPTGLIVNELVTNSLKYAFPNGGKSCRPGTGDRCLIRVRLSRESDTYLLDVSDNGVGLPAGLDIASTKSLGLRLVNFLARHQLRSKPEVRTDNGTEFVFRIPVRR